MENISDPPVFRGKPIQYRGFEITPSYHIEKFWSASVYKQFYGHIKPFKLCCDHCFFRDIAFAVMKKHIDYHLRDYPSHETYTIRQLQEITDSDELIRIINMQQDDFCFIVLPEDHPTPMLILSLQKLACDHRGLKLTFKYTPGRPRTGIFWGFDCFARSTNIILAQPLGASGKTTNSCLRRLEDLEAAEWIKP